MSERVVSRLLEMIEEFGEDKIKSILSEFSCPLNPDVEHFVRENAIPFSKQGLSQTHIVTVSKSVVGYYALANKYIAVPAGNISVTLKKRIDKFSYYDAESEVFHIAIPLIAQFGKNFANNCNELISGKDLLDMALDKIAQVQKDIGGRFAYIECEENPKLIDFYLKNGFVAFNKRKLDSDERDALTGRYLIQMIKYVSSK